MIQKLYFLQMGYCGLDQSALNGNLPTGKIMYVPVWSFLLETSDGPILIDTGMPDSFVNQPNYYAGTRREGKLIPDMQPQHTMPETLKRLGYSIKDIQAVISSHLHLDHAGGNHHFQDVPIYVQRAEYHEAIHNEDYSPIECREPNLNYHLLDGDYEVAPGIQLLSTPGHSAGHQSVLLNTEKSGSILLTVDVSYTRDNFERGVPFAVKDAQQNQQAIQRLQQVIQDKQPQIVFFGHDIEQAKHQQVYPSFF